MTAKAHDLDIGLPATLAFTAVVGNGVVSVFRHRASFTVTELWVVALASAVYLGVGISIAGANRFGAAKYVTFQNVLAASLIWLGHGYTMLGPLAAISQSGFVLPRRTVLVVACLHAGNLLWALRSHVDGSTATGMFIAFLTAQVFVIAFTDVAVRELRARTELAAAHRKLGEQVAQAEQLATMQERNRLARELHDSLGHYLTVIHVQLQAAEGQLEQNPARAKQSLAQAARLTHEGLEDVRRSVSALRASPMEQRPLSEAIGALVTELAASGVVARFAVAGAPVTLSPPAELTLYRAAQEALTNVRKHARARRADVELAYLDGTVRLTVSDDGRGTASPPGLGFGLLGVRERARLIGGEMEILTASGFALRLTIPVQEAKRTSSG